MLTFDSNDIARFWARVNKTETCWLWTAGKFVTGYGEFFIRSTKANGYAHRIAYELVKGPIPKGATLDHLCRTRLCVNPEHLEAVSIADNVMRGNGIPATNARKTHCMRGHEFTPDNTYSYRNGKRACKICVLAWQADKRRHGKTQSGDSVISSSS